MLKSFIFDSLFHGNRKVRGKSANDSSACCDDKEVAGVDFCGGEEKIYELACCAGSVKCRGLLVVFGHANSVVDVHFAVAVDANWHLILWRTNNP